MICDLANFIVFFSMLYTFIVLLVLLVLLGLARYNVSILWELLGGGGGEGGGGGGGREGGGVRVD